jgi:hypothetical protein
MNKTLAALLKHTTLGLTLLIAGSAAAATFAAPKIPTLYSTRFCRMEGGLHDQLINQTHARERVFWATDTCTHIPARYKGEMLYIVELDENGVPVVKPRTWIHYPVFGGWDNAKQEPTTIWPAPVDRHASCRMPSSATSWLAICESGCLDGSQRVAFEQGEMAIEQAMKDMETQLVTLAPDADLDNISYTVNTVKRYSFSPNGEATDMLRIATERGAELELTPTHPMLTANGYLKDAGSLKVGDALVTQDGEDDAIIAIEPYQSEAPVYGIRPDTPVGNTHILVAQGFLNGSSELQPLEGQTLNRMMFREFLPEELAE